MRNGELLDVTFMSAAPAHMISSTLPRALARPRAWSGEAAGAAAEAGVEQVADRVAEHVEAVHHDGQEDPRHMASQGATCM